MRYILLASIAVVAAVADAANHSEGGAAAIKSTDGTVLVTTAENGHFAYKIGDDAPVVIDQLPAELKAYSDEQLAAFKLGFQLGSSPAESLVTDQIARLDAQDAQAKPVWSGIFSSTCGTGKIPLVGGDRAVSVAGFNLQKYFIGGCGEMVTLNFTHVGPQTSAEAHFVLKADVTQQGGAYAITTKETPPDLAEPHTFTVTASVTGLNPAVDIPFVGATGRNQVTFVASWTSITQKGGAVSFHGAGFPVAGTFKCKFTDSEGTIKTVDANAESTTVVECDTTPAGFKIEDDGPFSKLTAELVMVATYKREGVAIEFAGDGTGLAASKFNADTCLNGEKDGDETDVDCGGHCGVCDAGKACTKNADCKMLCFSNKCINGRSCNDLSPGYKSGTYEVLLPGEDTTSQVYCLGKDEQNSKNFAGGAEEGWTLIATKFNPHNPNGRYGAKHAKDIFNNDPFGEDYKKDYKSAAYGRIKAATNKGLDILFYIFHENGRDSGFDRKHNWAQYNNVVKNNGQGGSYADIVSSYGRINVASNRFFSQCKPRMFAMTKSTFASFSTGSRTNRIARLCDKRLQFSPMDQDGSSRCACGGCALGPTWSCSINNGCPNDDPGELGAWAGISANGNGVSRTHQSTLGWVGCITGRHAWNDNGYGKNSYLQIYVRARS